MKTTIKTIIKEEYAGFLFAIPVVIGITALCFAFAPVQENQKDKWTAPPEADKKTNPVASDEKSIADGKILYTKNCKSCHGVKGKGDGPKSAELDKEPGDFTKEDFQNQSDGALFWKITQGKKPMPSFKKDMNDEQRWTVINYIRTLGAVKKK